MDGSVGLPIEWGEVRLGGSWLYCSEEGDNDDFNGTGYEGRLSAALQLTDNLAVRPYLSAFGGDDFLPRRGDPLYRRDSLWRLGFEGILEGPGGLMFQPAALMQYSDSQIDYAFQIAFSFGYGFFGPVLGFPY